MKVTLTIIRYPAWSALFGFLSMAVFRLPLMCNRQLHFYKLMGSGRNGTFDKTPDFKQWAILAVYDDSPSENEKAVGLLGSFINGWHWLFGTETCCFRLSPVEGHGHWDGKNVFGKLERKAGYEGMVAVLTRATIRLSKMKYFWNEVAPVANEMAKAPGFLFSVGIGEIPWVKQATFSIWRHTDDMKTFAYQSATHTNVIQRTHREKWYSEDMFVRFKIIGVEGRLKGKNPVEGML